MEWITDFRVFSENPQKMENKFTFIDFLYWGIDRMEPEKLATIAYVPRERFSATQSSLESILEHTKYPHDFVCVDGGSPEPVRQYLEDAANRNNFTLVRSDSYLSPNEARNIALQHVKTRYVVFVDNDVNVGTVGEHALGAGRGTRDMVGIFVGTGVGGGSDCGWTVAPWFPQQRRRGRTHGCRL